VFTDGERGVTTAMMVNLAFSQGRRVFESEIIRIIGIGLHVSHHSTASNNGINTRGAPGDSHWREWQFLLATL
jgi:hypothetical protein